MLFPEEIDNKKHDHKKSDEFIQPIPAHIAFKKIDRNTKCNMPNKVKKIVPDASLKELIVYPSEVFHIKQSKTQPVVLLCVNMVQDKGVIIISVADTTEINANTFPTVSPETEFNINQILQYIAMMYKNNKQLLPQQVITQKNSTLALNNCHKLPINFDEQSTHASITEIIAPAPNNDLTIKHVDKTYLKAFDNVPIYISPEYQMARCFHLYNNIFTEFLKTFALVYCTLTNNFLTRHKNMPRLCSHYWYFRNLTQGYVLKCLLKNGHINALNVMRNLYYIIITKCTSGTKIYIFFKFQDGMFTVYNGNQECRFTKILLNKEIMDEMDSMSSLNTRYSNGHSLVSNDELVYVQSESEENSDHTTTVSSSLSLPEYPSQSTFFEEEINTWHHCIEESEKERHNKKERFENTDPKYDLNDIYVNLWCGIQEFTESLRNFSHSTHELVYNQFCCTAGGLSRFDIFNEELFEITSFSSLFKRSSKHFNWESITKPFLQTLVFTLFSYVL